MLSIPKSLYVPSLSYISTLAERYLTALHCLQDLSSQLPEIIQYVRDTSTCNASSLYDLYGIDGETFHSNMLLDYRSPNRWSVAEHIQDELDDSLPDDYELTLEEQTFFNNITKQLSSLLPL